VSGLYFSLDDTVFGTSDLVSNKIQLLLLFSLVVDDSSSEDASSFFCSSINLQDTATHVPCTVEAVQDGSQCLMGVIILWLAVAAVVKEDDVTPRKRHNKGREKKSNDTQQ